MAVTIRPIRLDDAEQINACVDAVARERRYLGLVEAPPVEESKKFLAQFVDKGWPLLVAEHQGAIVGWCDISPMQRQGFTHTGILGMGLLGPWRGQGIGRRLAAGALAQAAVCGLERIQLDVYADNARAIALYESLGFAHEGVRRRARKLDGVYTDVVAMALLLAPSSGSGRA